MRLLVALLLVGLFSAWVPASAQEEGAGKYEQAAQAAQAKLEESIEELNRIREQAAQETIPLSRRLSELESELMDARTEFQATSRQLDTSTLSLTNLTNDIRTREQEAIYLSNLLGEYVRRFESRLHISELARYEEVLDRAKLALENDTLSEAEKFAAQAEMVEVALERLREGLGGMTFEGTAADPEGNVRRGTFAMVGPAVLFRAQDGPVVGMAEQRLGSLEPAVATFADERDAEAARELVASGEGFFPLDPTLGNAQLIEETEVSLAEHVAKGGPVMVPIFALAGAALLVVLIKWLSFMRVREPTREKLNALLDAVARHQDAKVRESLRNLSRPNLVRDFLGGAITGAVIGGVFGWALNLEIAREFSLWFTSYVPLGTNVVVYTLLFAAVGVGLQALLKIVLGFSPTGKMLEAGVDHIREPQELIEEIMYERVLETRLKLERLLPFVAISAAAAPLLGLLGTVTGIINTFQMITVFGSGDVKTLSGGISEALVTTEFGLIVAIPSLLLHAFLSRRARSVVNGMEKAAMAFLNQLGKTPYREGLVTTITRKLDIPVEEQIPTVQGSSDGVGTTGAAGPSPAPNA